jgi:hypothetical protein
LNRINDSNLYNRADCPSSDRFFGGKGVLLFIESSSLPLIANKRCLAYLFFNQAQCTASISSPSSQHPHSPHSTDIALAPQLVIIRHTASVTTLRTATIAVAHTSVVVVLTMTIPLRVARSE